MKERPIIFNSEMVRAILYGRKTQTRRIVKPQPIGIPDGAYCDPYNKNCEHFTFWTKDNKMCLPLGNVKIKGKETAHWKCPYGHPGDRLWVRETFSTSTKGWIYKADGHDLSRALSTRWKPSIHMPRWASRITLEITNVRVERLQNISEEDARAEGWISKTLCSPYTWYRDLWKSVYGEESWNSNPWIWVIEFKRV